MMISVANLYNEIFNAVQSRLNITIPLYRNARVDTTAETAATDGAADTTAFEEILVRYLDGDRSPEAVRDAIDAAITTASGKYGVDENLIKAIIRAESGYDPDALSKAGAAGLMQLMPGTARSLGVSDSYNIYQNVDGGTKFIKDMLDKFSGDESLALAAYNAGPGSVAKYGGVPPYEETQNYIPKVLSYKEQYAMDQYRRAAEQSKNS